MSTVRILASITRLAPPADWHQQLAADVAAGLTATPRWLPPKWFYDARGSELFEQITRLPEYYLTRAETEILSAVADPLVELVRPEELVELGSGSSRKTRLLLEAMHRHDTGLRYAPLDISEDALAGAAAALWQSYPWLGFDGYAGDFTADLPHVPHHGRRLIAFLGSTIGNYLPAERAALLASVAAALGPGDRFLLGADLVKDPAVLQAAYDDAAGVTAEFNRNVLRVLARELRSEVPVEAFEHVALYDERNAWIEMRLRAAEAVMLRFPTLELEVPFAAGEELRTEISCKFTRPVVEAELAAAGLRLERWDTDDRGRFALALATPA
ncbi:MAG TPA: L-histidine N(alpha)-methyltransferase [Actinomycetes bacterium]|nr:L-histidine N(alpha)-methyltransferase [Actinomycetes bacterium]